MRFKNLQMIITEIIQYLQAYLLVLTNVIKLQLTY